MPPSSGAGAGAGGRRGRRRRRGRGAVADPHGRERVRHLVVEAVEHLVVPAPGAREHDLGPVDAGLAGRLGRELARLVAGADLDARRDALERRAPVLQHGDVDLPGLAGRDTLGRRAQAGGGEPAGAGDRRRRQQGQDGEWEQQQRAAHGNSFAEGAVSNPGYTAGAQPVPGDVSCRATGGKTRSVERCSASCEDLPPLELRTLRELRLGEPSAEGRPAHSRPGAASCAAATSCT